MNGSIDDGYLGLNEAAVYLRIKPVTLRKWLKSKPVLPRYQIGKLWKFKKQELNEWVNSGKSANCHQNTEKNENERITSCLK